jgi:hypothetical protein
MYTEEEKELRRKFYDIRKDKYNQFKDSKILDHEFEAAIEFAKLYYRRTQKPFNNNDKT